MKKKKYFVWIIFCTVLLAGCTNGKKAEDAKGTTDTAQVADLHTAETSLDYYGLYKGVTPAADCPGIETTLTLNTDNTFTLRLVYIDRDTQFDETGNFVLDGNILTLTSRDGTKSYYKVEEGQVRMLNADKQEVTGELADMYILKQEKVF